MEVICTAYVTRRKLEPRKVKLTHTILVDFGPHILTIFIPQLHNKLHVPPPQNSHTITRLFWKRPLQIGNVLIIR